ncbi:MAG TPA: cation:proton antiporter, partial [Planktothrix sp. UBA8407]|nr:cation:proton antiporter [Planktothrix sp. UBA8407]
MTTLTLVWIGLPFFLGFIIYLLPRLDKVLALGMAIVSIGYGLQTLLNPSPLNLQLLDDFGVSLIIDQLSGYFILTNGLVTTAVILYCWHTNKTSFFYTQVTLLQGSVNAAFICADFMSLYVALEVIGIATFLLIVYPRS